MQARSAAIQNRKKLCYYNGSNSMIDRDRESVCETEREKERGRKVDVKNKRTNSQEQGTLEKNQALLPQAYFQAFRCTTSRRVQKKFRPIAQSDVKTICRTADG